MTKLIVKPIALSEPGSYRERNQFFKVIRRFNGLKDSEDGLAVVDAYDEVERLILPRLKTADGTPVEAALDRLSAQEFDALLSAIAFEAGETVPPANASSSTAARAGTRKKRLNG